MKCGTVTRSAMTDNFPEIDLDQVEAPVVGPGEPRRTPAIFKNKNEYFFQLKKLKKVASFLESASFLRLSSFLRSSSFLSVIFVVVFIFEVVFFFVVVFIFWSLSVWRSSSLHHAFKAG